jgi:hypothetical protein
MHADSDQLELQAAAARLESDSFFMAAALAEYRLQMRLNSQQLAKTLRCTAEALTNLALCRAPRLDDPKSYLADIQAIAKYAVCDWRELAKVVRAAQSLAALRRFGGMPENQLLKAARDKPHRPRRARRSKSRKR